MKLDTIALMLVIFGGGIYLLFLIFAGAMAPFPFGLVLLIVLGALGFLLFRVLWQHKTNAEDRYYEENVDK
ncbi:MAG: hypothetical protein CMN56_09515 [Sneathiella sp.]|mgnify:FL=1|uniref:hypothetical protein n=1 Tax=Sneathiella sp. TaxID=1964365 RepID=UPI000C39EE2C|nr:hypothetical protein [Sneathiella sp.]MAZ03364.1 hypothetical protein [Sneathiella sp.]